jgi:hypothetical protein
VIVAPVSSGHRSQRDASPVTVPEALAPLAWLVGDWAGEGRGEYPTISDFAYREETAFAFVGKPYLVYTQRTWLDDGSPSHMEMGFVRPGPELVIAYPIGVVEVLTGDVTGEHLELSTAAVAATPTAKSVTGLRRVFERRGDALWYSLDMAAVGQPMTFHCEATLHPVPASK